MKPLVIIGSGLAGYTVAREFRKHDSVRAVILITAENGDFYSKPVLSNAFAQNRSPDTLVSTSAAAMSSQLALSLLSGTSVTAIDTVAGEVETSLGRFEYGDLVLALGASPVRAPLAGNAADEVVSVNSLADYQRFRDRLEGARRVLVLGAGLVGCEFANDLALGGYEPVVVAPVDAPLPGLVPAPAAAKLASSLSRAGVTWKLGATASSIERNGRGLVAMLSSGESVDIDAAVSTVGLRPNVELAQLAGITVDRGICVDTYGRTNVPNVYALGDCAQYAQVGVLPFVLPVMTAARAIASTLAGAPTPIEFGRMPVSVKTTSYPVALHLPVPATNVDKDWEQDEAKDGFQMLLRDADGALRGFVAAGTLASRRAALMKELG
jgi:rubredoxin-NAD+ reductase